MGEIRTGPPLPGAPWHHRVERRTLGAAGPARVADADAPRIAPEIRTGPPMPGAPWFKHTPRELPWTLGTVIYPGNRGGQQTATAGKPFLARVPRESDERRLARFTEQLASLINSLVAQGILLQTGPASWSLRLTAGSGGGLTGTFS